MFLSLNPSGWSDFWCFLLVCLRQLQGFPKSCDVFELFERHNSMAIHDLFQGEF